MSASKINFTGGEWYDFRDSEQGKWEITFVDIPYIRDGDDELLHTTLLNAVCKYYLYGSHVPCKELSFSDLYDPKYRTYDPVPSSDLVAPHSIYGLARLISLASSEPSLFKDLMELSCPFKIHLCSLAGLLKFINDIFRHRYDSTVKTLVVRKQDLMMFAKKYPPTFDWLYIFTRRDFCQIFVQGILGDLLNEFSKWCQSKIENIVIGKQKEESSTKITFNAKEYYSFATDIFLKESENIVSEWLSSLIRT